MKISLFVYYYYIKLVESGAVWTIYNIADLFIAVAMQIFAINRIHFHH